ncbi:MULTISPECIES: amidase domain-containing protein [unclassified Chryseobacterium]|nr:MULTISPECIES: amidase domain-containing protein [unclassified Chryseobacterium]PTT73668.1 hypothetical protein DBR25_12480 [Chryseobacterium sp. HMWF001]PVV50758.1 hypothetical protein DD829_21380 [Chryseobacterium sp. HMWF035]
MKKTTLFTLLTSLILGFLMTGCQPDDSIDPIADQNNQTSSKIVTEKYIQKEIVPIVQNFLNAQYDYLIGKDNYPQWNTLGGGDILKKDIDNYMSFLQKDYTTITSYTSKVQWQSGEIIPGRIGSFKQSGDILIIYNILDSYTMNYHSTENGVIDDTESSGGIPYNEITLKFTNGVWKIESWIEKGNFGTYSRWYVEQPIIQDVLPVIESNTSAKVLTTYNRTAAKDYAYTYVFSPSSNYPDYTGHGGDCTNFVSQCLQSGGWTQVSSGTNKWFHLSGYTSPPASGTHRSPSWTGADYLKNYIANSGRIVLASYPLSSMEIGDVVHLLSEGKAYHSMLVTKKTGSGNSAKVYVTYRNATSYSPAKDALLTGYPESNMIKYKIANS